MRCGILFTICYGTLKSKIPSDSMLSYQVVYIIVSHGTGTPTISVKTTYLQSLTVTGVVSVIEFSSRYCLGQHCSVVFICIGLLRALASVSFILQILRFPMTSETCEKHVRNNIF